MSRVSRPSPPHRRLRLTPLPGEQQSQIERPVARPGLGRLPVPPGRLDHVTPSRRQHPDPHLRPPVPLRRRPLVPLLTLALLVRRLPQLMRGLRRPPRVQHGGQPIRGLRASPPRRTPQMPLGLLLVPVPQPRDPDLQRRLGVPGRRRSLVPPQCDRLLRPPGEQDPQVERGVHASRLRGLGEPRLRPGRIPALQQEDRQRVGRLPVPGVGGPPIPLLGLRGPPLLGTEQPEVVRPVVVPGVHRGPVPPLGGLRSTSLGMQRAQRVRRVAVALLRGPQPPHGGALGVPGVPRREPERAGGPRLTVLGGRRIQRPASLSSPRFSRIAPRCSAARR
ncbi:hypothetical protein SALBM311S_03545 [Streptomyces alboniger]